MTIRIASLAAVLTFAIPAVARAQACSTDRDCPGNAICERGVCADPNATASPVAAPADQPTQLGTPVLERRGAIKTHPLVPLLLLGTSGLLSAAAGFPVLFLALPIELEYALTPNFTLVGSVTPLYLQVDTLSGFGGSVLVGGRYYFVGTALDGAFAGVGLGVGGIAISGQLPGGIQAPGVGFDAQLQLGYQWVIGGFVIGVVGTWSPLALAQPEPSPGLGFAIPIGFAF